VLSQLLSLVTHLMLYVLLSSEFFLSLDTNVAEHVICLEAVSVHYESLLVSACTACMHLIVKKI